MKNVRPFIFHAFSQETDFISEESDKKTPVLTKYWLITALSTSRQNYNR